MRFVSIRPKCEGLLSESRDFKVYREKSGFAVGSVDFTFPHPVLCRRDTLKIKIGLRCFYRLRATSDISGGCCGKAIAGRYWFGEDSREE